MGSVLGLVGQDEVASLVCNVCVITVWQQVNLLWLRPLPREWKIQCLIPACAVGFFSGLGHASDLKIGSPVWLPCHVPGIIRSTLGLVRPVSVYCDWVK